MARVCVTSLALLALGGFSELRGEDTLVRGEIVDAAGGALLPARLTIRGEDGSWRFAESDGGTAVRYDKQRFEACVERHVTLSAHPFRVALPPGRYTFTAQRGKEYLAASRDVTVAAEPVALRLELVRFADLASRGWYSGDTHVHRTLEELPNLVLAEDLNVALPLLSWVTEGFKPPTAGADVPPQPIEVDATHVIYPRNTEYEIFTVGGARHTLGAIFILGHRTVFEEGVPPLGPMARRARAEGALFELDKHNWPWSMALVPILDVDLFELSNNHIWETQFGFTGFGEREAAYMDVERDERGFTERGWIDFGFQNWYALLDCGFRLRPTAGTASGVHPVPLGFGRVYAHVDGEFSFAKWMAALDAGRSFVTTGPLLLATLDGKLPGETFEQEAGAAAARALDVRVLSAHPLESIELVRDGAVRKLDGFASRRLESGAFETRIDERVEADASTWVAVRCWERRPDGRPRFAHSAAFFIDVPGQPLRPRRVEVEYLVERVATQIERSREVLPAAALEEYREALAAYRKIAETAR